MATPGPLISDRRFAQLLRVHTPPIAAYARATAPDRWTAEDAVQETFLRAWKYLDSYRATGSFEGWLLRLWHNCLGDLTTRRGPEAVSVFPENPQPADHSWEV